MLPIYIFALDVHMCACVYICVCIYILGMSLISLFFSIQLIAILFMIYRFDSIQFDNPCLGHMPA